MLKKMSISSRITIMVLLILTICTICLTIIINSAANYMVTEAVEIKPAMKFPSEQNINLSKEAVESSEVIDETNIKKLKDEFYLKSILGMIAIIAIGGILCNYMIKKALNPLAELNKQIQDMNITNLAKEIEVPKYKDEVTQLTESFNTMTDKLNSEFTFQSQFSANVAHELRTPLTVLKTKINVFNKKEEHSQEEYKELLTTLEKQITRLSEIIQNLLEINSTEMIIEKEMVNFSDIMNEIIADLSNVSQSKNITFITEYNDIEVYGNIDLLYRAFYNLIENSIKYNNENGSVKILSKEYDDKNIIIKIIDTGIGIPEESKMDIFKPFYRVEQSRSREIGGAGLGLSIVKNIIKKHNGEIIVSSNEPKGCIFSILLPKK